MKGLRHTYTYLLGFYGGFIPNGQRSLVGYSQWGHRESDTAEWLSTAFSRHYMGMHAQLFQSYLILRDPMDCSPPGASVHGIFQARILEWITMPSSRGSSKP